MNKVRTLDELAVECREWRRNNKRIVWTNGCFDLFHAGHIRALEVAAALGDVLIVGLNSDRSVRELKEAGRPLCCEADRAALLSALETVTRVVIFDSKRCDRELAALQPHVWTKSGDYTIDSLDASEREAVQAYGGEIKITPLIPGISTTLLVKKIRRTDPEKIVSAACSFIQDRQGRLLLVSNRYADAIKWSLPGGGQCHGETLADTARRETLEETGLAVDIVRHMGVIERIEPAWGLHLVMHVFAARAQDPSQLECEDFPARPNEYVTGAGWFSPERMAREEGIVLGRQLWLTYGHNPDKWPSYIVMAPGEE